VARIPLTAPCDEDIKDFSENMLHAKRTKTRKQGAAYKLEACYALPKNFGYEIHKLGKTSLLAAARGRRRSIFPGEGGNFSQIMHMMLGHFHFGAPVGLTNISPRPAALD